MLQVRRLNEVHNHEAHLVHLAKLLNTQNNLMFRKWLIKLEEMELIERIESSDQRKKQYILTKTGNKILNIEVPFWKDAGVIDYNEVINKLNKREDNWECI